MELKDYVRIVRAHWVGVLVLMLVGLGLAAVYNLTQPRVYQASATGIVSSGQTSDASTATIQDSLAKSKVATYVTIATSARTAQDVITALHLKTSPSALVGSISVEQPTGTVAIKINADAGSPVAAQALANEWVKALAKEVGLLDGVPKAGAPGIRVEAFASAGLPSVPLLPRTNLNFAIGLLAGLLLGFGYALVRQQLDRRLRSSEEVEKQFSVPVIGMIPQSAHIRQDQSEALALAVIGPESSAGAAEAFRKLRTNLAYMDVDSPPRIIVVTSPKQSDGKSTVAANLAAAMAVTGQPVTLIDGDLRRPTVADSMAVVDGAGLTDVLVGRVKPEEVIQDHPDIPGLRILASGAIPPNPSELLGSQSMRQLMASLAEDSMVIIDAPPLLPVTDAAVLTRSADGAIVVITHGGTLDSELSQALNHITTVHGRTLGVVFNRMRRSAAGGYYGGDSYRYEYKSGDSSKAGKAGSPETSGKPGKSKLGRRRAQQASSKG